MVENLGRKTLLIFALLLGATLAMVLPEQPFRMGLDLSGGSRMVYRLDWDKALSEGKISAAEHAQPAELMKKMIGIMRNRVDRYGTLEASFKAQGDDRIVIEIPISANVVSTQASGVLLEEINGSQSSLSLEQSDRVALDSFPLTGAIIAIGGEHLSYDSRQGNLLYDLRRGINATTARAHAAGEVVELKNDDPIRSLIENPGAMKLYIAAEATDFPAGSSMTAEQTAATEWRAANQGVPITTYNGQFRTREGLEMLRAFPRRVIDRKGQTQEGPADLVLVWDQSEEWTFRGEDLENINKSQDRLGYPAVALTMSTAKEFDFGDFTETHKGKGMAIVLNDVIVTLANIKARLQGSFIIEGGTDGFTEAEVSEMVRVLQSGSLVLKPEIEQADKIGARLGEAYVKTGFTSALLGLALVLVFMMLYYRKLGIFAAVSLLCSLVLLMGAMAFARATLTLPGVAGIILTVGMAVDANILIYERIREELRRGRKLPQACENGFNKAFVTIIDANLTTFITAFVLYYIGTGPVRGFATTLMAGIASAVFSALVITRVLVHLSLSRGTQRFGMAQIIGETHVGFMAIARKTIPVSLILLLGGVGLFASQPDEQKLSIDFVGGMTVTVRTQELEQTETIRDLVGGIEGNIGKSADVVSLRATGNETDGYRAFRITYKTLVGSDEEREAGAENTGQEDIRKALVSVLQRGPVEAKLEGAGAAGQIYFGESHPTADIQALLQSGGFGTVAVEPVAGFDGAYAFTASESVTGDESRLTSSISNLFNNQRDSTDASYLLAEPIPESSMVGAQVVGEMRDKAILAILVSLFAVVMYIRVRFAEYSYGFAAVAALVHDVLMTLGALAIATQFNLLEAELSLPMVAAFLTIIGYSLNDTIVVFDRIRENRPRMTGPLSDVLNTSINQTLSRTLLTSATTFIAVLVLLVFNYGSGSALEGFAFALCFGVIVGTYSSIFIASPTLLYLENRHQKRKEKIGQKGAAVLAN